MGLAKMGLTGTMTAGMKHETTGCKPKVLGAHGSNHVIG